MRLAEVIPGMNLAEVHKISTTIQTIAGEVRQELTTTPRTDTAWSPVEDGVNLRKWRRDRKKLKKSVTEACRAAGVNPGVFSSCTWTQGERVLVNTVQEVDQDTYDVPERARDYFMQWNVMVLEHLGPDFLRLHIVDNPNKVIDVPVRSLIKNVRSLGSVRMDEWAVKGFATKSQVASAVHAVVVFMSPFNGWRSGVDVQQLIFDGPDLMRAIECLLGLPIKSLDDVGHHIKSCARVAMSPHSVLVRRMEERFHPELPMEPVPNDRARQKKKQQRKAKKTRRRARQSASKRAAADAFEAASLAFEAAKSVKKDMQMLRIRHQVQQAVRQAMLASQAAQLAEHSASRSASMVVFGHNQGQDAVDDLRQGGLTTTEDAQGGQGDPDPARSEMYYFLYNLHPELGPHLADKHSTALEDEGFEWVCTFELLTDADLEELGVKKKALRRLILRGIKRWC